MSVQKLAPRIMSSGSDKVIISACEVGCDIEAVRRLASTTGKPIGVYKVEIVDDANTWLSAWGESNTNYYKVYPDWVNPVDAGFYQGLRWGGYSAQQTAIPVVNVIEGDKVR